MMMDGQLIVVCDVVFEQMCNGLFIVFGNLFFGVGLIIDVMLDEVDSCLCCVEFDYWIEVSYCKFDDIGKDFGLFLMVELLCSMYCGYLVDVILLDMMCIIYCYFEFFVMNCMVVGLGGGYSGFIVCVQYLLNVNDVSQCVYVDMLCLEQVVVGGVGFFCQFWVM